MEAAMAVGQSFYGTRTSWGLSSVAVRIRTAYRSSFLSVRFHCPCMRGGVLDASKIAGIRASSSSKRFARSGVEKRGNFGPEFAYNDGGRGGDQPECAEADKDWQTSNLGEDYDIALNSRMRYKHGMRSGGRRLRIPESDRSIPAKFSKYTRWRNSTRSLSRSLIVKQQMKELNSQNQSYYREKSVFFRDYTPPVIKPDHVYQFSYSENPKPPPIGFREPVYSPFGPENMDRPWTGKRPYDRSRRELREFDSFKLPPPAMRKARFVEPPGPFLEGTGPKLGRSREEILGEPLNKAEVHELVRHARNGRRQLDLGRDGLTHNMLDLLHRHWKRRRVCRIKCYGVPTVDMDNLCRVLEDKSGGKIICRAGGILYLFRGRNYNWNTRPKIPLMLWKPPAPIYPSLIQSAPEGLTVEEADNLRMVGRRLQAICHLRKAGVYLNLVQMVKNAFQADDLVKVDCKGLDKSDKKKIGAKLRDVVPCVLLSFERHSILLWKGTSLQANRDGKDISVDATARSETIILEDSEMLVHDEETVSLHFTRNTSKQEDKEFRGDDETDEEESTKGGCYKQPLNLEVGSSHKLGGPAIHEQNDATFFNTADMTAESHDSHAEHEAAPLAHDGSGDLFQKITVSQKSVYLDTVFNSSVSKSKHEVREQVNAYAIAEELEDVAVSASTEAEGAAFEVEKLWGGIVDCKDVAVLDRPEDNLHNDFEQVTSRHGDGQWSYQWRSLEQEPSSCRGTSNLGATGRNIDRVLISNPPYDRVLEQVENDEVSENFEVIDLDRGMNTLGTSREAIFSSTRFARETTGQREQQTKKAESFPTAEIVRPEDELKRLQALRLTVRGWIMIGGEGISRGIVKSIHNKWLTCEVAKVRYAKPGCSMKKVHEDLERLTGGSVIWREGPAVLLYRGNKYVPGWISKLKRKEESYRKRLLSLGLDEEDENDQLKERGEADSLEEREESDISSTFYNSLDNQRTVTIDTCLEEFLSSLGPRYTDWTGGRPVPVDGDLLLSSNVEFKSPFRRLPYGVRPRLTNFEMTEMRHLAGTLCPHFVLGKSRGLKGLASAIVKLWEKSEIVKVGVKRGVSRTDVDRVTEELRRLTGGDLVAKNMEYVVLFRGNDFLPPVVKNTLEEKDRIARELLEEEERVRLTGSNYAVQVVDGSPKLSKAGTLAESLEEKARWNVWQTRGGISNQTVMAQNAARIQASQRMQRVLQCVSSAAEKIKRAEKELLSLNANMRPTCGPKATEQISEEERYTFRKIGLRMKPFLLLGRREVFGGTIENMHLHWKWRELVKIIVKRSYFMYREKDEVERIAKILEDESGGILVGIVSIPVGEAIIVYRGKDYKRPTDGLSPGGHPKGLRPRGLLTKMQAQKRFSQKRRKLALERHLQKLNDDFNKIQHERKE